MNDLIRFDYAIKYLLKDKGDYEIVEGFISALLASEGYGPVKIKALLECESNKESRYLKRSIADLIVEDESGAGYIVEIDRSYTDLFLHKAVFNTSRLIVDNLGAGQDYFKIKKIFHINLLYFPFEGIKSPLSHGKTIFHGIEDKGPIDVNLIDKGMHIFEGHNIFPEYFLISIPLFDDVIRKEIDEWLYLMKYSEIKKDFKSPYMKKAAQRLKLLKMSPKERAIYESYMMESFKGRDYAVSAEAKGRAEGKAEGKIEGKAEGKIEGKAEGKIEEKRTIAKVMLLEGDAKERISKITGLSLEEIEKLKS